MKKRRRNAMLRLFALISVIAVGSALIIPNFVRARSRGSLTACKSNLKNLGTAAEMYSMDWDQRYPPRIGLLTPNYLKTIPECPNVGRDTYSESYTVGEFESKQFVCRSHGENEPPKECRAKLQELNSAFYFSSQLKGEFRVSCPTLGKPYSLVTHFESYLFYCRSEAHKEVGVPSNYPQYNGIQGLIER